ncbi:MAG: tRNA uridine-5-carboxymethylaminomethyl(34) synthesis GTPase MnmE [Proteobacteria bacterium]|nr:tRNA uridine-5-carboxymethylaminomethyl(34) synthesis GTPase MnmE [Pseudomonadota bacterium]
MTSATPEGTPDDTIFALASGRGRAGVAVLRLSGAGAGAAITTLTRKPLPEPRRAAFRALYDPQNEEQLDQAIVLWFPAPASFTGEDVAELHVHGGRAVLDALSAALSQAPPGGCGCRPAEPGEFSLRAFRAGKMDLTEAEGLNDLIEAETEAQRRQALDQLGGALSGTYEAWRRDLVQIMARAEAMIDFSDEDVPGDLIGDCRSGIESLRQEIAGHLSDNHRGERVRAGYSVVILGAPNAGKSSLLNALAREDVAITAESPGTTRDVIEVRLDLGGFAVDLADTAGLRKASEASGAVEREGVRRAEARAASADLKLLVLDAEGEAVLGEDLTRHCGENSLLVVVKTDLVDAHKITAWEDLGKATSSVVYPLSSKTGAGVEALLKGLEEIVIDQLGRRETASLTRLRHRVALEECDAALARAGSYGGGDVELLAEDLRLAADILGRITGTVDVENILDVVFGEFCIGK